MKRWRSQSEGNTRPQRMTHFDLCFLTTGGSSAATMACQNMREPLSCPTRNENRRRTSSNTFFKFLCVSAEHSTYLTAPSSFANLRPSSSGTGVCFWRASFSRTVGSSRRSICVPTMRHGTPGQWWKTSGNHFSRTFSNEAGEVTLKQTRKTSVCGYDSGRRRS